MADICILIAILALLASVYWQKETAFRNFQDGYTEAWRDARRIRNQRQRGEK